MSDFSTLVMWGQLQLLLVAVAVFRCSELRAEKLSEELLKKVTEEMLAKSQMLTLNLLFSLCCRKYAKSKIMASLRGQDQSGMLPFYNYFNL